MTSPQQPGVKIWAILAALAPPALVGAGFWTTVREHPLWSTVALAAYFALLFGTRVLKRVVEPAIEEWIRRATPAFYGLVWRYRARYLERLEVSLKFVELLGAKTRMEFAVRLPDVYVDLSLKRRADADSHAEDIETDSRISLDSLIDTQDGGVFVITGGPGSGKTTLLRFKALQLAAKRTWRSRLPIVLELRHHVKTVIGDPNCTVAALTASPDWLHGSHGADWFERQLQRGRCLVMLDGLDEVADEADRRKVVAWVRRQTDRYRRNPFVVTSRPHGYRLDRLSNADELEVRRFTGKQIHRFVHNWYRVTWMRRTSETGDGITAHASERAEGLIDRLQRTPVLFKLSENPLLLTMITNLHITGKALPANRASLYGEICEMLLHKRDVAKALVEEPDDGLTVEQKLQVSWTLASHMMHNRVRDLSVEEAHQVVRGALASASRKVTAEDFLVTVENGGLLLQPVEGEYAFAHLTFQEYLAAMALREANGSAALAAAVDDPWWWEVTLLWAAGANATLVVEACLDSGSAQALRLALSCSDEAREITPETRARLERLRRSVDEEGDRVKRHEVIAAQVGHALGNLAWLGEETVFVAKPVDTGLYNLYLSDLDLHPRGPVHDDADEVRLNLWDVDVSRFVDWVNGLPGVGGTYRLPTSDEASDDRVREIEGVEGRAIWVQDGARPVLHGRTAGFSQHAALSRIQVETQFAMTWQNAAVKPLQLVALREVFARALADIEAFLKTRNPNHRAAVDGLLWWLDYARAVAPGRARDREADRMRQVRDGLRDAVSEDRWLRARAGTGDVIASLRDDFERERDQERKALLDRQLRSAQNVSQFRAGANYATSAAERSAADAITVLRPRLLKSRDLLDELIAEQHPEFAPPAKLDAVVKDMLDRRHAQAVTAPGGILPVLRVVLLGAWNELRLSTSKRLWLTETAFDRAIRSHAIPQGASRGVRFAGIPAMLDAALRALGSEQAGWQAGIVTLIEHARTRLAPILDAEMQVDPEALASMRLALAAAALTSRADGESRRLIREVNRALAVAEHRALATEPPPEVLLLVRD